MFQKIIKLSERTFLGVMDFIESDFTKKTIEVYFQQLEWAIIATAIWGVGMKLNNTMIILFGIFSVILLFVYSMLFWVEDAFRVFKESVFQTNERNKKFRLPPYSEFSTTFCFIFIILFLNTATWLGIYYGVMAIQDFRFG